MYRSESCLLATKQTLVEAFEKKRKLFWQVPSTEIHKRISKIVSVRIVGPEQNWQKNKSCKWEETLKASPFHLPVLTVVPFEKAKEPSSFFTRLLIYLSQFEKGALVWWDWKDLPTRGARGSRDGFDGDWSWCMMPSGPPITSSFFRATRVVVRILRNLESLNLKVVIRSKSFTRFYLHGK